MLLAEFSIHRFRIVHLTGKLTSNCPPRLTRTRSKPVVGIGATLSNDFTHTPTT